MYKHWDSFLSHCMTHQQKSWWELHFFTLTKFILYFQLDFWLYNAFPEKVFDVLLSHHSALQRVKEIKRGQQFAHYSEGSMIPKGGREAMGGAKGDTYALYTGMDAVTMQDIDSLFDDAEVRVEIF